MVSFTPLPLYSRGKSLRYPLDRDWVGPREGLDVEEKRKSNPGRPACGPSLYRPSYRCSLCYCVWLQSLVSRSEDKGKCEMLLRVES
jgi:hypothetical protein